MHEPKKVKINTRVSNLRSLKKKYWHDLYLNTLVKPNAHFVWRNWHFDKKQYVLVDFHCIFPHFSILGRSNIFELTITKQSNILGHRPLTKVSKGHFSISNSIEEGNYAYKRIYIAFVGTKKINVIFYE